MKKDPLDEPATADDIGDLLCWFVGVPRHRLKRCYFETMGGKEVLSLGFDPQLNKVQESKLDQAMREIWRFKEKVPYPGRFYLQ